MFDLEAARKAGHSYKEIAEFLTGDGKNRTMLGADVSSALTDLLKHMKDSKAPPEVTVNVPPAEVTVPDNVSIVAIKAKTDSLAFTVAGQVDVNLKSVAGASVAGAGTSGDPWRPA